MLYFSLLSHYMYMYFSVWLPHAVLIRSKVLIFPDMVEEIGKMIPETFIFLIPSLVHTPEIDILHTHPSKTNSAMLGLPVVV